MNYKYKINLVEAYTDELKDLKLSIHISEEQAKILEENFSKLGVEQVTHESVTDYLCEKLLECVKETVNVTVDEFKTDEEET